MSVLCLKCQLGLVTFNMQNVSVVISFLSLTHCSTVIDNSSILFFICIMFGHYLCAIEAFINSCVCYRCEDMVDVRRLKMLQMVQLFKCEEDALQVGHRLSYRPLPSVLVDELCVCAQAVEWLGELLDALLKTHVRLGDDCQETRTMLDKHRKFVDVAQVRHKRMTKTR